MVFPHNSNDYKLPTFLGSFVYLLSVKSNVFRFDLYLLALLLFLPKAFFYINGISLSGIFNAVIIFFLIILTLNLNSLSKKRINN